MYITLRNLILISKKKYSILHFYQNYFTLPYIDFSIKNITFYIDIGYFLFYIYFYLHQDHIKFIIVYLIILR